MVDMQDRELERQRKAQQTLDRVHRDSDVMGQSSLARAVDQARSHMAATEADQGDRVEVWGRRIGRALSAVVFVILAVWLINYLAR